MRLDSITIGSPKDSPTHRFRNLKDVQIDFDENQWVTVLLGGNGTGKSNVLEALAIIFRDLIAKKKSPAFAFDLRYKISSSGSTRLIHINADPDRYTDPYLIDMCIYEDGSLSESELRVASAAAPRIQVKLNEFLADDHRNLPKYVFSYYSGDSSRMHEIFRPYLEAYDRKLRSGDDPGPKRLFYAMPVHSQFVLLAFMIQNSPILNTFLDDRLGIDPVNGIESVLFVLKQPGWSKRRGKRSIDPQADTRFWGAKGVVQAFLNNLYEVSLAPIRVKRKVQTSFWNEETSEFLYLYLKDLRALQEVVGEKSPLEFFRDLESTYVSELIDEVRIRVRLGRASESLTFRELSEGEQQLLTVLGLLKFTADENSLFLLDEPDTHLNPRWSAEYLSFLKKFVGESSDIEDKSHVILTTHNPLAIAELSKEQVQVLRKSPDSSKIEAISPEADPRGMGYAGIITSDMFGLDSALDSYTLSMLEEKRNLSLKNAVLDDKERHRLEVINQELEGLGFQYSMRDPDYEEFLRTKYGRDNKGSINRLPPDEKNPARRDMLSRAIIRSIAQDGFEAVHGGEDAPN